MTANTPSGKTRLMTLPSDIRPEGEIISELKKTLESLLWQWWTLSTTVQTTVNKIHGELLDLWLSQREIFEIGTQ